VGWFVDSGVGLRGFVHARVFLLFLLSSFLSFFFFVLNKTSNSIVYYTVR
jgi:hypothetical protein